MSVVREFVEAQPWKAGVWVGFFPAFPDRYVSALPADCKVRRSFSPVPPIVFEAPAPFRSPRVASRVVVLSCRSRHQLCDHVRPGRAAIVPVSAHQRLWSLAVVGLSVPYQANLAPGDRRPVPAPPDHRTQQVLPSLTLPKIGRLVPDNVEEVAPRADWSMRADCEAMWR